MRARCWRSRRSRCWSTRSCWSGGRLALAHSSRVRTSKSGLGGGCRPGHTARSCPQIEHFGKSFILFIQIRPPFPHQNLHFGGQSSARPGHPLAAAIRSWVPVRPSRPERTTMPEAEKEFQWKPQKPKTHKPDCLCWRCGRPPVPKGPGCREARESPEKPVPA